MKKTHFLPHKRVLTKKNKKRAYILFLSRSNSAPWVESNFGVLLAKRKHYFSPYFFQKCFKREVERVRMLWHSLHANWVMCISLHVKRLLDHATSLWWEVEKLADFMAGWIKSPAVPNMPTTTKTHKKTRSMTMPTYFQSFSICQKNKKCGFDLILIQPAYRNVFQIYRMTLIYKQHIHKCVLHLSKNLNSVERHLPLTVRRLLWDGWRYTLNHSKLAQVQWRDLYL